MAVERRADWRPRLEVYLRGCRGQAFGWGRLDCALFAAGAVEAMTGTDLARGWRGYRSASGGLKKLAEAGFDGHFALADSLLPAIPPKLATPGDIVGLKSNALGVVQGRFVYCLGPAGLGLAPMADAVRAWKV